MQSWSFRKGCESPSSFGRHILSGMSCNDWLNIKTIFTPLWDLLLQKCLDFYEDGSFKVDDEGDPMFCTWCGNGGDLILCSTCKNAAFCKVSSKFIPFCVNIPNANENCRHAPWGECLTLFFSGEAVPIPSIATALVKSPFLHASYGPKNVKLYPHFSLCHKSNWIFSSRLPNFEQNQSGRFLSMVPP